LRTPTRRRAVVVVVAVVASVVFVEVAVVAGVASVVFVEVAVVAVVVDELPPAPSTSVIGWLGPDWPTFGLRTYSPFPVAWTATS